MSTPLNMGMVQFSVDLTPKGSMSSATNVRRMHDMSRVRQLFGEAGLPVTCVVPGMSDVSVRDSAFDLSREELAWSLYDGTSVGTISIPELRQHIDRERRRFEERELTIRAVSMPSNWMRPPVLDPLVDWGISTIRGELPDGAAPLNLAQPKMIRQGLWLVTVSATYPQSGHWLGISAWDDGYAAKSAMIKAIQTKRSAHIAIQLDVMEARGASSWRSLATLLRRAVRLRDNGLLACRTMSSQLQEMQSSRTAPAVSILRAA